MMKFFDVEEDNGIYKTLIPPFDYIEWPKIISPDGFIWICNPSVKFSEDLTPLIANGIFGTSNLDIKCSIHRLELDISIPALDFLRFTKTKFRHGIDFIQSDKHQPLGLHWTLFPKSKWPIIMAQNQIKLFFQRPAGGEPSILTSQTPELLFSIINKLKGEREES